jgi:hypothetical protein
MLDMTTFNFEEIDALTCDGVQATRAYIGSITASCAPVAPEILLPPLGPAGTGSRLCLIEQAPWHWPDTKSLVIAAAFLRLRLEPVLKASQLERCFRCKLEWILPKVAKVLKLPPSRFAGLRVFRLVGLVMRWLRKVLA